MREVTGGLLLPKKPMCSHRLYIGSTRDLTESLADIVRGRDLPYSSNYLRWVAASSSGQRTEIGRQEWERVFLAGLFPDVWAEVFRVRNPEPWRLHKELVVVVGCMQ